MPKLKVTQTNFEMTSKNTKVIVHPVLDQDGIGIDGTSATAKFAVSKDPGSTAIFTKTIGSGIVRTTDNPLVMTITIAPADTDTLAGTYYFEMTITDVAGRVSTTMFGTLNILRNVNE